MEHQITLLLENTLKINPKMPSSAVTDAIIYFYVFEKINLDISCE